MVTLSNQQSTVLLLSEGVELYSIQGTQGFARDMMFSLISQSETGVRYRMKVMNKLKEC